MPGKKIKTKKNMYVTYNIMILKCLIQNETKKSYIFLDIKLLLSCTWSNGKPYMAVSLLKHGMWW